MRLAGYILHTAAGGVGPRGSAYTYIMAGNGLLIEADNGLLEARVLFAPTEVRGLPPLETYLRPRHGLIPRALLALAIYAAAADPDLESYAAIVWDGQEYRLVWPPQQRDETHVTYEPVPGTVVNLHSHGRMEAFFSSTDDRDDQGFQVSVVLGHADRLIAAGCARLCIYGYITPVDLRRVFQEPLLWIEQAAEM